MTTFFKRSDRVADQIKREIAGLLLKKVKDPRVAAITVTAVKVTSDLKKARVYYTLRGNEELRNNALKGLNSARGYLRFEIGRALSMKNNPELEFFYDSSFDYAERIEELIHRIKEQDTDS